MRVLNVGRAVAWWWRRNAPVWFDGTQHRRWADDRAEPCPVEPFAQIHRRGEVRLSPQLRVWVADGWVYRERGGARRAIGPAEEVLAVGPNAAVLVGDADAWITGASATGSLKKLPIELARGEWGLRWSDDGGEVAGQAPDGRGVSLSLAGPAVIKTRLGALPIDTDDRWLDLVSGALTVGQSIIGAGMIEASCCRQGHVLGGPGGVAWDLRTGQALFSAPTFLLGATVATEGLWATADWESGDGHWVDTHTGEQGHTFNVPLVDGDVLTGGFRDGDAVVFVTAEHWAWRVLGDEVEPVSYRAPPAEEHTAVVDGIRYAWDSDGWLSAESEGAAPSTKG